MCVATGTDEVSADCAIGKNGLLAPSALEKPTYLGKKLEGI